jgi:hypothetical protein
VAGWHGEERHAQPGVDAEREGEARKGALGGGDGRGSRTVQDLWREEEDVSLALHRSYIL